MRNFNNIQTVQKTLFIIVLILVAILLCKRIYNNSNSDESKEDLAEGFSQATCRTDIKRTCSKRLRCEANEMDLKAALAYANRTMCKARGYTYTQFKDGSYDCSHTKQTCLRDSKDPEKGTYLEWHASKNKCIYGMEEFKNFCKDNPGGLKYDDTTGKCHVTSGSCDSFGADFENGDCKIPDGQKFGEAVVGTTTVRSMKKGFKC